MVRVSSGGKAYLFIVRHDHGFLAIERPELSREQKLGTYQERKATRKPDQEKKNVRPYLLMGFNTGIDRAFPFKGLTSGATQRWEILKGIVSYDVEATIVTRNSRNGR